MSAPWRTLGMLGLLATLGIGSGQVRMLATSSRVSERTSRPPLLTRQASLARQASSPADASASPEQALVARYCVTCHSDRLKTAGLSLEKVDPAHVSTDAPVWEKVVRKVRSGAMPPAGAPRPDKAAAAALVVRLETALDQASAASPNLGPQTVHRLNRTEYANAIRDVLALDIDASTYLPADESAYGFDNIAHQLTISPGLFDRYLAAARKIGSLAVGDLSMAPSFRTYNYPEIPSLQPDAERALEGLPLGSVGGAVARYHFPVDAEYLIRISARGKEALDVRLDGERVALLTPEPPKETDDPNQLAQGGAFREVTLPVKAGTRQLGIAFKRELPDTEGLRMTHGLGGIVGGGGVDRIEIRGPYNVTGPGDTPSRRRIFVCRPVRAEDGARCARTIVANLAGHAYRRPATEKDVQILLSFYENARKEGDSFEGGIQAALERVLISPDFLFRSIPLTPSKTTDGPQRLTDLELATRLSFFLWSSVPDEELLGLAERGKLSDPKVLEQQTRRMLADPRSAAFTENFAGQWLYLRNVLLVRPDPYKYPEFDENLRNAFYQETRLFVESQFKEDRSVVDLLSADYTFLNERLARHYRVPNVYGSHFRRVALDGQRPGGLLGQGTFLTVTSHPDRTSAVLRGKWVLENILGAPPPPPPANVPPLAENGKEKPKSLRERMEQHRKNPVCATCHARMDPIGFALEHFDGIGGWRPTDAGVAIDSSGVLPDGTKFDGAGELRNALMQRREEFVLNATEKLFTYALGRGVEYYDEPAIRRVMRAAAPNDYRWSSLILGVVTSPQFETQLRRKQS